MLIYPDYMVLWWHQPAYNVYKYAWLLDSGDLKNKRNFKSLYVKKFQAD